MTKRSFISAVPSALLRQTPLGICFMDHCHQTISTKTTDVNSYL